MAEDFNKIVEELLQDEQLDEVTGGGVDIWTQALGKQGVRDVIQLYREGNTEHAKGILISYMCSKR